MKNCFTLSRKSEYLNRIEILCGFSTVLSIPQLFVFISFNIKKKNVGIFSVQEAVQQGKKGLEKKSGTQNFMNAIVSKILVTQNLQQDPTQLHLFWRQKHARFSKYYICLVSGSHRYQIVNEQGDLFNISVTILAA